jgi:hypothetical protein
VIIEDKHSVPGADGLNYSEIQGLSRDALEGGRPRPIRKRGFHRALRRGIYWAVFQDATVRMVNELSRSFFARSAQDELNRRPDFEGLWKVLNK